MPDTAVLIRPAESAIRSLPANVEAEAAFLGAVLIDNRVIEELGTQLAPLHFFEPVHARIYERILQLLDRKAVVTPVTLRPYFDADEALKELGGVAYLARLTAARQAARPSALRSAGSAVWLMMIGVLGKSRASDAASARCHHGVWRSNERRCRASNA